MAGSSIPRIVASVSLACLARRGAAALAAAAVVAAQAAGPAVPLEDFVRRGQFGHPALSPDGKHLVVTLRVQAGGRDEVNVAIYDLTAMKLASQVRLPLFELPAGYWWVSNTRLALTTAREYGSLEAPRVTGEIVAMDIDGRNQEYLYGYNMYGRSKRGTFMPNDEGFGSVTHVPRQLDGHFLLTEHLWSATAKTTRLYDINSLSAARKLVTEIKVPYLDFVVQDDGTPRFATGNDEDATLAVYRFDDATREWGPFGAGGGKGDLLPLALSADNATLVANLSVRDGPRRLVRQPLAGGEPTVLASDEVGSVGLVEQGPRPSLPFAAVTRVGAPQPRYFDEDRWEAKLHKQLSAQFVGSYVHFVDFSQSGDRLLFSVSSDRDPGAFYIFDRPSGRAALLFAVKPWIEPERMAERRPIRFKARDGLELHGYLTLPPSRDDGKLPLVLLPHGGPHGVADKWEFDSDSQFLASRGYAVLQVNYRGSGGRGPGFQAAGYRQWGRAMQDDLIDGLRWIVGQGTVDPQRICSYGASFGAYSAMMTAIRAPELVRCAIGYAGLYDLAFIYDEPMVKRRRQVFNHFVRAIGQDPAELAASSPTRLADKLTAAVFLAHGGDDEITPPVQAEAMRDALKRAGRAPEWLYVPGEGHGFYSEANRKIFYEKLEAFLAKHIGATAR